MKKVLIFIFLLSALNINAQLIGKWSSLISEQGYFLDSYRNNNLVCLDENNVLLINQKVANTSPFLTISHNGGKSWNTIFTSNAFEYEINAISYPKSDWIVWAGDTTEYQGMEGYNTYFKRSGIICTTTNGGENWEKIKIDSNSSFRYVAMLNTYIGIASKSVVANRFNNNLIYCDTLFYTPDFFKSFSKIPVPNSHNFVNYIKMFSEDNFIIKARNIALKKSQYLETTNRGVSWKIIFDELDITDIYFLDRQNIFLIKLVTNPITEIKESEIIKSTNGGIKWQHCFSPKDSYWTTFTMNSIAAADKNNIIVVGDQSSIFRSEDGGLTWNREYVPNDIEGGFDLEYNYLYYLSYPKVNCAYITSYRFMFKSDGIKILSRPILNRYSGRINPSEIKAYWSPVEGAKKYQLQLAKGTPGNAYNYKVFYNLVLDTIITDTLFIIKDLEYNQCYYARLRAISDDMESEWNIKASMFCTFKDASYTNPPVFLYPKQGEKVDTSKIDFTWNSIEGADEYRLEISKNPYFASNIYSFSGLTDTIQKAIELTPNQYYARVRIEAGTKISEWSSIGFTVVEPNGIHEYFSNSENSLISPNPASDYIIVGANGRSPLREDGVLYAIRIFDIYGKPVLSVETGLRPVSTRIDISSLPAGVYFVRIGEKVEKFVKM